MKVLPTLIFLTFLATPTNAAGVCHLQADYLPDYIPQQPAACPVGVANYCSKRKFGMGQTCATVSKNYGLTSKAKCSGENSDKLDFKTAVALLAAAGCCGPVLTRYAPFVKQGACDLDVSAAICETKENWEPKKMFDDKSTCQYQGQSRFNTAKKCKGDMHKEWHGYGTCSLESKKTEAACIRAGTCSDPLKKAKTACINSGTCSDPSKTTEADCLDAAICSDTSKTTQAACINAGTCRITSKMTQSKSTCTKTGTCSDISQITEAACVDPASWIPRAWQDAGRCTDRSKATQSTCIKTGTCSNTSHLSELACLCKTNGKSPNYQNCGPGTWTPHVWINTGICTDASKETQFACNVGRCSNTSVTNHLLPEYCVGSGATWLTNFSWTPHSWIPCTWTQRTWKRHVWKSTNKWKIMTDEVAKKCCKGGVSACPFIEPASSPSSGNTETLADSPASLNSSGSMLHVGLGMIEVAIVIFVAVSCALFV